LQLRGQQLLHAMRSLASLAAASFHTLPSSGAARTSSPHAAALKVFAATGTRVANVAAPSGSGVSSEPASASSPARTDRPRRQSASSALRIRVSIHFSAAARAPVASLIARASVIARAVRRRTAHPRIDPARSARRLPGGFRRSPAVAARSPPGCDNCLTAEVQWVLNRGHRLSRSYASHDAAAPRPRPPTRPGSRHARIMISLRFSEEEWS
jgi:hypothetical protein